MHVPLAIDIGRRLDARRAAAGGARSVRIMRLKVTDGTRYRGTSVRRMRVHYLPAVVWKVFPRSAAPTDTHFCTMHQMGPASQESAQICANVRRAQAPWRAPRLVRSGQQRGGARPGHGVHGELRPRGAAAAAIGTRHQPWRRGSSGLGRYRTPSVCGHMATKPRQPSPLIKLGTMYM
jgi:hypothetical protein